MKRSKRHRVKLEQPETSTSKFPSQKEHDLAYYIHDRVELMHQVFSVLKSKELKAMAPECVRHISVSDLQELCMEELLGISSKRLCAILDGATPPSDTESSSESEQLETISLDSISSDEEILSQVSAKKSKKHKHRSKSKPKKRSKSKAREPEQEQADRSRRAGLTVLELLELQARARAIRAQLQQEAVVSTGQPSESVTGNSSDDDEVEIKEEAAEVVEISSEDEKPNIQQLEEKIAATKDTVQDDLNSKTVTKKVNDLIITVPKANTSRKIKLKRNTSSNSKAVEKVTENESNSKTPTTIVIEEETDTTNVRKQGSEINKQGGSSKLAVDARNTQNSKSKTEKPSLDVSNSKDKNRSKDKKKKRKKDKQNDKDGSDDDEITLQLSDTEKMDLLEDLDGKKPKKSSDTEDSSSDSSDEDSEEEDDKHQKSNISDANKSNLCKDKVDKKTSKEVESSNETASSKNTTSYDTKTMEVEEQLGDKKTSNSEVIIDKVDKEITENDKSSEVFIDKVDKQIIENDKATSNDKIDELGLCDINKSYTEILEDESANTQTTDSTEKENVVSDINVIESSSHDITEIDSTPNVEQTIQDVEMKQDEKDSEGQATEVSQDIRNEKITEEINVIDKVLPSSSELNVVDKTSNNEVNIANKENLNEKSDGELSDRDSSEVEASDFKPDVVCISDDDEKKGKKKKKKDKKSKKEKKSKKKKDFRGSGDQNFYTEKSSSPLKLDALENEVVILEVAESNNSTLKSNSVVTEKSRDKEVNTVSKTEEDNSEDIKVNVMENLKPEIINTDTDLDDDVYEILELSDDSSCYEVEEISISKEPTAEEIEALSAKFDELERNRAIDGTVNKKSEELDHLSWKERYLKSTKVKKVLTTANIMNAMRKKNLELKKKLQESKKDIDVEKEPEKVTENVEVATNNFEDGTIDQYNTLEASTKYVDPVKEPNENSDNTGIENGTDNTKEKDTVTKEMKKEAKQLLKMYKMLLKYNDMTKQKDPNKKKKKKKKNKEKDKSVASQVATG